MNFNLVLFSCLVSLAIGEQICPEKCLCEKETLNCSSKELIELPGESPVGVRYGLLDRNRIRELRPRYFDQSKEIEQIYLANNEIERIERRQFADLEKLRLLDLQRNRIRFIGEQAFKGLYSIERINLEHNQLKVFDENIGLIDNILKFKLILSANPLNCNCDLVWLLEKARINQLNLLGTCREPDLLNGLALSVPILPHLKSCPPQTTKRVLEDRKQTEMLKNVIIGDSVVLNCPLDPTTTDRPRWFQNDRQINFNYSSKFQLYPNGSLRIRSLMPKDENAYACEQERLRFVFDVRVVEPPIFSVLPDQLYELNTGTSLSLECNADASPEPIITWFNKSLNRNLTTGSRLYFRNVSSSLDGNYLCIAANQFGYAVHEFTINVRGGELEMESRPSNQGLGSRLNTISELFTDEDVREAVQEARAAVEQAIDRTVRYVLEQSTIEFPLVDYKDQQFYSLELTNQSEQAVRYVYPSRSPSDRKPTYRRVSPNKLMKIGRFPLNQNTIESAKSTEIYEKAIELLKRKAEMRHEFQTLNFTYTDALTTNQLNILNSLTGCLHGNRHHNLLRHRSCEDKPNSCHRTIDGTCNNLKSPLNGAALTPFRRLLKPIYEDGLHLPVGWLDGKLYNGFKLPNPRRVTLKLLSSLRPPEDDRNTHMLMALGQFLDHDLTFSLPSVSFSTFDRINSVDCQTTCSKTPPCYSIPLEPDDVRKTRPHLLPNRNTTYSNCIELIRSSSFCGSGLSSVNLGVLMPREQVNQLTSYLDLSQVYGSTPQLTLDLRNLNNDENDGRLRTSSIGGQQYLPLNEQKRWPNDCQQEPDKSNFECFLAGDIRSNEQLGLTVLHTLFLREHNRLADELKRLNAHWTGYRVFQEARHILIAKMQHIVYGHWLVHVLGPSEHRLLGAYPGYNQSEDASISNVFATSAFRFGHTLVQPFLTRLDENYQPHPRMKAKLNLFEVFFSPHLVLDGLEPVLRGLIHTPMKKPQPSSVISHQLTENLFELARHVSLDLASINIQRGREHGIPGYNEWRTFCGLSLVTTFEELKNEIRNQSIRNQLKELYGHPSNIDLWVGCVLEDQLENAKVGPTFSCLIREQLSRTRSADRFWYERFYSPEKRAEIERSSLAEIICLNTQISRLTRDVFLLAKHQSLLDCRDVSRTNLTIWKESAPTKAKKCY